MIFRFLRIHILALALASTCAQSGCMSARTVGHPTFANFGCHLREGNQVDLVMEDGERLVGTVTAVRPDGIMLDGGATIPYGAFREARRVANDSGETRYRTKEALAPVVAVGAVAGAVVVCPILPLLILVHAQP